MYGSQGSIGLLVPSVNTVVEPEFNAALPRGYVIHSARMRNSLTNVEDSIAMLSHVGRATDELGSANVDIIVFACTASSFVEGREGEAKLRRRIERHGQTKAVTTSEAVRESLLTVNADRISMVTPYTPELNTREVTFLEESGIAVLSESCMNVVEAYSIANVDPEATARLVIQTMHPNSEAVFLSCTNLKTFEIISDLEHKIGVPVVSSNSATLAATLKALQCEDKVANLGLLFDRSIVARADTSPI